MSHYMKLSILFGALFALSMILSADTFAGGNASAGKAVYQANCSACHGADGNSPLAAMGMSVPSFAKGDSLDVPFDERFNSVCKGKAAPPPTPAMPAFCGQLSDDDIKNALAYSETLKK